MRTADITVAIATLDRPESLARCLDGVLNGLVLPAEIIIVDQSRENATQTLIAGTDRGDGRIIYVRQERCGLGKHPSTSTAAARIIRTIRVIQPPPAATSPSGSGITNDCFKTWR